MPRTYLGTLLVTVTCLMHANANAADPAAGKQVAEEVTVKNEGGGEVTVRYWLFLPQGYDRQDAWPLMLFMHGAGERGDDLELVKKWGPPKLVAERTDFPFVVISPQCPREQRWDPVQMAHLVDHVAGTLKIDKSRMYCTGLSMGGYGTWATAAKYPKLFAAAVPICGGGDPQQAERLKDQAIWAFHGEADRVVPVARSQELIDAIGKLGSQAQLTVYPGVGHNSWSQTYANQEVYDWLLSHRRPE